MKQFLPCKSLQETLSALGLTESNLTVGESTFPAFVEMQHRYISEAKEVLKGGIGDGTQDSDFDPEELAMGIQVEKEHTNDARIAREIAHDHLSEDPHYYSKLKKMENPPKEEPNDTPVEEAKTLHDKGGQDVNVLVVMIPDDEYSKTKQSVEDLIKRTTVMDLINKVDERMVRASEVYGVWPVTDMKECLSVAQGLLDEVEQARQERSSDQE